MNARIRHGIEDGWNNIIRYDDEARVQLTGII